MLKQLAFAAAAAAVVLGGVAANASDASQEVKALGAALRRNGVGLRLAQCNEPGLQGYYRPSTRQLTICKESTQKWTTLKHEAWHAVQHCWGGPVVTTNTPEGLFAVLRRLGYKEHQLYTESDARRAAAALDGFEIAAALDKACAPFRF